MISLYEIYLSAEAAKILSKIDKQAELRIRAKLKEIAEDPYRHAKLLTGHNLYSLRVGPYRVILKIERNVRKMIVVTVGHRRTVYDRRI